MDTLIWFLKKIFKEKKPYYPTPNGYYPLPKKGDILREREYYMPKNIPKHHASIDTHHASMARDYEIERSFINPATGLLMVNSVFDCQGNVFGTSYSEENFDSSNNFGSGCDFNSNNDFGSGCDFNSSNNFGSADIHGY